MSDAKQAFADAYEQYKHYAKSRSDTDLTAFHDAYRQAVIKFARKHIPQSPNPGTYVATDLVSDSFLKLAEEALAGKEFASALDIQKHALVVIRNRFFDYARSKNTRRRAIDPRALEDIHAMDHGWEVAYLDVESLIRLDTAVQHLEKVDTMAAFIARLFIYGGQSQEEIAKNLEVSTRTIRRSLLKLGARLQTDQVALD